MTIWKLVKAFNDLRALSNDGQLQYPFSTRELVGIVKHLERFPKDPVELAVKNVFDFDAYSNDTLKTIESVFKEHKISVELAQVYTTKERLEIQGGDDFDMSKLLDPKYGKVDPKNAPHRQILDCFSVVYIFLAEAIHGLEVCTVKFVAENFVAKKHNRVDYFVKF